MCYLKYKSTHCESKNTKCWVADTYHRQIVRVGSRKESKLKPSRIFRPARPELHPRKQKVLNYRKQGPNGWRHTIVYHLPVRFRQYTTNPKVPQGRRPHCKKPQTFSLFSSFLCLVTNLAAEVGVAPTVSPVLQRFWPFSALDLFQRCGTVYVSKG